MPTTYTRTQIRQEVLKRWPELGWAATADSVSTTAITDVSEFAHTGYQSNEFKDYWIHRYLQTTDDVRKRVGEAALVNTTGVLTQDSTVYVNTADLAYELLGIDPRDLNYAIAQAQQLRYFRQHFLLPRVQDAAGNAADMDMETTGTSMWDGNTAGALSNTTVSKVTTAQNVYSGVQALRVLLSVAAGYARSATFRVTGNYAMYVGMIARADVGTVTLKVFDVTNSAYIQTATEPTYSGEQFALLEWVGSVPATCEEVLVEIRGTGSVDDIYVDSITGPWVWGTRRIQLPTWLNEQYKVTSLRPSRYRIAVTPGNRVWDAYSRYFVDDWKNPKDFTVEDLHRDTNGYFLNLEKDMTTEGPYWLQCERSRAVLEPMTAETSTTTETVDGFNELMEYVLTEVAKICAGLSEGAQKAMWEARAKEHAQDAAIETGARPAQAQVQKHGVYNVRA